MREIYIPAETRQEKTELKKGEDKEEQLRKIKEEVEKTKDRLGKPIEQGIKDTVVMLKAFKIEISQSCEGHIEKEEVSPPWIEIYPTEPEREDWTGDEELRSSVEKEGKEMRLKILNLLNEFYEQEKVPFDQMLGFKNVGYGFRIQNNGAETLGLLDKKIQEEKVEIYKTEIERLTQFLKDKYFEKPELKPEQVLPKRKE
ncbi:hypothetical protein KKD19_05735, partial [Patescibacteria group bacterium]|nr:hypothetical protein [Patescibacteria group bacterium]MCG2693166.1 hypothetical protein [Candidatus Parcubacteria bacterium]